MFLSPLKCNLKLASTKLNNNNNNNNNNYKNSFQPKLLFKPNNLFNQKIIFSPFSQTRANSGFVPYSQQSQSLSKPRSESNQGYTSRQTAPSVAEILLIDTAPTISIGEISFEPFSDQVIQQLGDGFKEDDVEIKPDGIIYLPEIKYRRILNAAFGAGGWVLIPRGAPIIRSSNLYREYALYCYGKFVSQAVGEQIIHPSMSEGTAVESSKSNALMRCCKDLGVASELWDPNFIEHWKANFATQVWCKNEKTGESKLLWKRKDRNPFAYPWKENSPSSSTPKFSNYQLNPPSDSKQNFSSNFSNQNKKYPQRTPPKLHNNPINNENDDGEDVEVSLEESLPPPSLPHPSSSSDLSFDPNGIVPPFMKRFAGQQWKDVGSNKDGINYLVWASNNQQISAKVRNLATQALDWFEGQEEDSPDDSSSDANY